MPRDDEAGVMAVLEAILVALLVLTAILFVSTVQRPLVSTDVGGVDLGRLASETIRLLKSQNFTDASGKTWDFEGWVNRTMDGDTALAAQVETFVRQVLPTGTRSTLLLSNGVGTLRLVPTVNPGLPRNGRASETPFFPHWGEFRKNATTDAGQAGWGWPDENVTTGHPVLANFTKTTGSNILCIKAPDGSSKGPTGLNWTTLWRNGSRRIPAGAPYGIWAGYTNAGCSQGVEYARVALRDGTAADYPIYGIRLVVWFGT